MPRKNRGEKASPPAKFTNEIAAVIEAIRFGYPRSEDIIATLEAWRAYPDAPAEACTALSVLVARLMTANTLVAGLLGRYDRLRGSDELVQFLAFDGFAR